MFAKSLSRVLNCLAAAIWLGIVIPIQAASVTITDHTPQAVTPGWAAVTLTLDVSGIVIDPVLDIPEELGVTCTGGDIDGGDFLWYLYNSGVYPMSMWVGNIDGDITFVATMVGGYDTLTIPCGKITSIAARMVQDTSAMVITAANFDQDIFIKATFSPVSLPTGLTVDDVSWGFPLTPIAGAPWAKLPAPNAPGHPTVQAQLGSTVVSLDLWLVKIRIKEVEFTGTDFAEVALDPQDRYYNELGLQITSYIAPHWDVNNATPKPVQYKAGAHLECTTKFTVEPIDYTQALWVKANGAYSLGALSGTPAAGELEVSGLTSCDVLPPNAGQEFPLFNWEFMVGDSAYSESGASGHHIYRTLSPPIPRFRTIIDIACTQTSSSNPNTAFEDIWTYFAGKGVSRWDSASLYYYAPAEQTVMGLLQTRNGDCIAWTSLFKLVQDVHGNTLTAIQMKPKPRWRFMEGGIETEKSLVAYSMYTKEMTSQGSGICNGPFGNHVATVRGGTEIFDPSFGVRKPDETEWQNAMWLETTYSLYAFGIPLQGTEQKLKEEGVVVGSLATLTLPFNQP